MVEYSYRVKIINKDKRSEFMTRELKSFSGRFKSVRVMKHKIMEELDNLVPSAMDFQVGYFSGKQNKKHWLIEDGDLKEMYEMANVKKKVFLWCDGRVAEKAKELKRKHPSSHEGSTKNKRVELE